MTDEEYTFRQDVRDKSSTAVSSKRKVLHTKGCSLPYESLSYKQRQKLNGEVKTVMDLGKPISYQEFRSLPDEFKIKYIQRQQKLYGATQSMFCQLFHCGSSTMNRIYHNLGLYGGVRGKKPTWQQQESWKAFCNGVIGGGNAQKEEPHVEPVSEPSVYPEPLSTPSPEFIAMDIYNVKSWDELTRIVGTIDISSGYKVCIKLFKKEDEDNVC